MSLPSQDLCVTLETLKLAMRREMLCLCAHIPIQTIMRAQFVASEETILILSCPLRDIFVSLIQHRHLNQDSDVNALTEVFILLWNFRLIPPSPMQLVHSM